MLWFNPSPLTSARPSRKSPADLEITCRLSLAKISLLFHLVGTGRYTGLNEPTIYADSLNLRFLASTCQSPVPGLSRRGFQHPFLGAIGEAFSSASFQSNPLGLPGQITLADRLQ
jgi:hypothetical protein